MSALRQLGATWRGLRHRGGSTVVVALIALVASAAAAVGPTYAAAARTSVLQDTLQAAAAAQRGLEIQQQGDISADGPDQARALADGAVKAALTAPFVRAAVGNPIEAIEGTAVSDENPVPLDWRDGECAHLRLLSGHCPTGAAGLNQVVVSAAILPLTGWRVGQVVPFVGWAPITVVGIYQPPSTTDDYWFDREPAYFPLEFPASTYVRVTGPINDAMFTVPATFAKATTSPQGSIILDYPLFPDAVTSGNVALLGRQVGALANSDDLDEFNATARTSLPTLIANVQQSWTFLAVPVLLATVQLLALIWLLLFLVVTDVVEARSAEIALAKLRGYRGRRLLVFALTEPVTLLLLALPVGVVAAWGLTMSFTGSLLRPGTPVGLPALSWAAAAAATLGGVAAVSVAARRVLVRPIVEQWRRAGRRATDRGWVFDAIVLTAAVAGLVQLQASGGVTSVRQGSLGLLVPGLLGLAVAVVSSRLLPLACRALFRATRTGGGTPAFLAVRLIARRPGGVRTTMILATAFALATFGTASWVDGASNRTLVAQLQTGAPVVMTVAPSASTDLGAIVDRLDPAGRSATAVDSFFDATGSGLVMLGVEPSRFAAVASWRSDLASGSLASLTAQLDPPVAAPITLDGDAIRLRVTPGPLPVHGVALIAYVDTPLQSDAIEVPLATLTDPAAQTTPAVPLVGCPCQLSRLALTLPEDQLASTAVNTKGALTISDIEVRRGGRWQSLSKQVAATASWRSDGSQPLTTSSAGLRWPFGFAPGASAGLSVADVPNPLPALVASPVLNAGKTATVDGFNAQPLLIRAVAEAKAVPSSDEPAVVVDRTFAERDAHGYLALVSQQVWTTRAAESRIRTGLEAAGVKVASVATSAQQKQLLDREGPALASVLFLADSVAAALLAATAAVLGLVVAARRRRYEFAALATTGVRRRDLFRALLAEQATVLAFGALAGVAAGLAAALLSLKSVPQLATPSLFPPLSYRLDPVTLTVVVVIALGVLAAVAAGSSRLLLAGAHAEQLREGDL